MKILSAPSFVSEWSMHLPRPGAAVVAVALVLFAALAPLTARGQLSTSLELSPANRASAPLAPASATVVGRASSGMLSDARPAGPGPVAPIAGNAANPYGLAAIWLQGDWVAKGCLLLLAIMSIASWYALVAKALALRRLQVQTRDAQGVFEDVRRFAGHVAKLPADNPVRFVADTGSAAVHQYAALRPRVDYDTWVLRAIEQALSGVQTRMQGGMAVLATVGSTAPFVGLFGTVWAIYTALVKIGASGQASIDRVAGPVGEALIMTAIGLAVAVPAVFGYNWLLRKNRLAFEALRGFGAQLHGLLLATTDVAPTGPDAAEAVADKPAEPGRGAEA